MELHDAALHAEVLLAYLAGKGVKRDPLLKAAGVGAGTWEDPFSLFPYRFLAGILEQGIKRSGDKRIGFNAARCVAPEAAGTLFYYLSSDPDLSATTAESYRVLQRLSNIFTYDAGVRGDRFRLTLEPADPKAPLIRHMAEFQLTLFVNNFRKTFNPAFHPEKVTFTHGAPQKTAEYEAYFQCPVRFAHPQNRLEVDTAWLNKDHPRANLHLHSTLKPLMLQLLEALPEAPTTAERVRVLIARRIEASPTLSAIAAEMQVRPRTLQFWLAREGTSFRNLLDEIRSRMAREILAAGTITSEEFSYRLGYQTPANFHRAFKRWTGNTPQEMFRRSS